MFKKIYFILIVLILNSYAKELELTENGLIEKSTNKLITKQVKFNEAISYSFEMINNSNIYGNYLLYEEFNSYQKKCYIPILNYNDSYIVDKITCFELDFPNNLIPYWYATKIDLDKKYNLNELNIKDIIENINNISIKKVFIFNSLVDKENLTMSFSKLPLYDSQNSILTEDAIFRITLYNDLVYFDFEDLILK